MLAVDTNVVIPLCISARISMGVGSPQSLRGLENVTVEAEASIQAAFSLTMSGVEFADAIHLKRLGVERVSLVPPKK